MKVISTNIAELTTISWRGKEVETGIYKYPVTDSITLEKEDVVGDYVVDRRYHGGVDKACYMYASDHYPYWKDKYPDLEWTYGMFGENLTVEGLDERDIKIGSIYKIGTALIQVSQPRQPCYKLGVRFGTQTILKDFIASTFSGVYLRVLEPGFVRTKDVFELQKEHKTGISIKEMHQLLYNNIFDENLLKTALKEDSLISKNNRESILKKRK